MGFTCFHRSDLVKEKAANLEIGLTFIPAGQTDEEMAATR